MSDRRRYRSEAHSFLQGAGSDQALGRLAAVVDLVTVTLIAYTAVLLASVL
jgi:hypothetical protein